MRIRACCREVAASHRCTHSCPLQVGKRRLRSTAELERKLALVLAYIAQVTKDKESFIMCHMHAFACPYRRTCHAHRQLAPERA